MEWSEENKARLYAALYRKLERIKDEFKTAKGSEGFFLAQDKYDDFLHSIGILRVKWKKSKKIPPHWITESKTPAETENNIFIPNPISGPKSPRPTDNYEKHFGLCIPMEIAERILAIGPP